MIQTPKCPRCGATPVFILADGHQCFCGTERCPVLTWDSHETAAVNEESFNVVDLDDEGDGE